MDSPREFVRQFVARIVRWGIVAARPEKGFIRMEGRETDPEEPLYQEVLRFLQQYGFRSCPRPGSEMAAVSVLGATNNRICVATETPGTGPEDQEEGEVELYAAFGQRVILDKDGQITITAKNATVKLDQDGNITIDSAPGKDVVLNGGSATVAREGDDADGGGLSVVVGMGGVAQVLYREPDTLVYTVVPTFPAELPLKAKLGPGAPRVKA